MRFAPGRSVSLALRIALASALFGLVVAAGAVFAGYWTLSQQLDARSASDLQGRHELLVHILAGMPSVKAAAESSDRFDDLFFGHDDLHLALVDPATGRMLASNSAVASHSVTALLHATDAPETMHSWVTSGGQRFSGMHGTVAVADGKPLRYYLSVERQRDSLLLAGVVKATLVVLPLLLVLVAMGAWLTARTGLAPLRRFNRLAASIGAKSLDQRVSMAGLPGELADMAVEFNGMMERIAQGYRRLEDFSGDLAHEMRTPVATLLGRTQVALSHTRTAAQLREVLEGNVEELDRLSALISDMLFIARAEHDAEPIQAQTVDLAQEARRVAEYLSLVADEKNVQVRVEGTAPPVAADRLLIERAITNLLSNAIRHAAAGSVVDIELGSDGLAATVAVTNRGETIPEAHLNRIFDRFYRVDSGRARLSGGTGLGLAIVKSIALAHQGRIAVRSGGGLTTFTLSLPDAASAT